MNYFKENESTIGFTYDNENSLNVIDYLFSKDISSRLIRKLYKDKRIYLNEKVYRKGLEAKIGDKIVLVFQDEKPDAVPKKMNLDIIYEDDDLLLINKAPFMVVHPTKSHDSDTLSNGIAYHFTKNNIKKKVRFINRLDMNTSGILMVAKNPYAHQQMALQFEKNLVQKKYIAIVEGHVRKDKDILDMPIGKEKENIKSTVILNGQNARTTYSVLNRFEDISVLDVEISTGRSHQIRVHLSHIGHSILGDTLYGNESSIIHRQALHSYYIKISHPRTKKIMTFTADLPQDMKNIIEQPN